MDKVLDLDGLGHLVEKIKEKIPVKVTTESDGLITQLPDDENLFFNGVGEWVEMEGGGGGGLTVIMTVVESMSGEANPNKVHNLGDTAYVEAQVYYFGSKSYSNLEVTATGMEIVDGDFVSLVDGKHVITSLTAGGNGKFYLQHKIVEADIESQNLTAEVQISDAGKPLSTSRSPIVKVEELRRTIKVTDDKIKITSTPKNTKRYDRNEEVTFETTITNNGNVTIKNLILKEKLEGAVFTEDASYTINPTDHYATIDSFEPTKAVTFKSTYSIKEEDLGEDKEMENSITVEYLSQEAIQTVKSDKFPVMFNISDTLESVSWDDLGTYSDKVASDPALFKKWVGQTKSMNWGTYGDHEVQLIGLAHDDLADGSGKAAYTFAAVESVSDAVAMNAAAANVTYEKSTMNATTLPAIYAQIDTDVKAKIVQTTKNSITNATTDHTGMKYSSYLHLLAPVEVFPDSMLTVEGATAKADLKLEGSLYDYYSDIENSRIKNNTASTASPWWLRSVMKNDSAATNFANVAVDGSLAMTTSATTMCVVPSFSMGAPRKGIPRGADLETMTWKQLYDATGFIKQAPDEYKDLIGSVKSFNVSDYGDLDAMVVDVNHYGYGEINFMLAKPLETKKAMNAASAGKYSTSAMNTLMGEIAGKLPEGMKEYVGENSVAAFSTAGTGDWSGATIEKVKAQLYLPSVNELNFAQDGYDEEGTAFQYFSDGKKIDGQEYWTRSISKINDTTTTYGYVDAEGALQSDTSDKTHGVDFVFNIGQFVPTEIESMTWPELAELAESVKSSPDSYASLVGMTKEIDLGSTYGKQNWMVVDIDHEWEGTKYGLVFMPATHCLGANAQMNAQATNLTYGNCSLPKTIESTIFNSFPAELQSAMKNVTFKYNSSATTSGWSASANTTKSAKLFLPCIAEMFAEADRGSATGQAYKDEGTHFRAFTDNNSRIRKEHGKDTATDWWLRSLDYWHSSYTYFALVSTSGTLSHSNSVGTGGVCPCFAL